MYVDSWYDTVERYVWNDLADQDKWATEKIMKELKRLIDPKVDEAVMEAERDSYERGYYNGQGDREGCVCNCGFCEKCEDK